MATLTTPHVMGVHFLTMEALFVAIQTSMAPLEMGGHILTIKGVHFMVIQTSMVPLEMGVHILTN